MHYLLKTPECYLNEMGEILTKICYFCDMFKQFIIISLNLVCDTGSNKTRPRTHQMYPPEKDNLHSFEDKQHFSIISKL